MITYGGLSKADAKFNISGINNASSSVQLNGYPVLDANGRRIPTEKSYNIIAKDYDAQYFQIDNWDDLIKKYGEDQMWKINEKFLDIQTSSGREIYLSHNPNDFTIKTTSFSKEIQYLKDNGYSFVKEGDLWHAIW